MAKTEEGDIGVIEKLAVIADAMEDLFSDGKIIGVFELNIFPTRRTLMPTYSRITFMEYTFF